MKLTKLFSILTLVLGLSFGLNSCNDTTTTEPVVTVEKLAAPTNLMATSFDYESITIKWTASTDETNANFKGYEIICDNKVVTNGPAVGNYTYTANALTMGEHTFKIRTLSADTSKIFHSDYTAEIKVVNIEKLAAPTNLMATSFDKESVILKWTLSTDETNANFKGYEIRYDGKLVSTGPTTGANTFTVSGLTEGEHVFSIKALTSDSTKKLNSDAITLTWAPAWRFTKNVNDEAIQLFETASDYGSGLNLFDATGSAPKTLKVASIADWTIGIETKTDGVIKFGPVASLNYTAATAKNVQISAPIPATGLNDLFDSQALSTKTFKAANGYEDLASLNSATGVIFVVKETIGSDVRYAKVFVKKATSGFLQGTAPNRNIEVEISYQNKLNTPYAK